MTTICRKTVINFVPSFVGPLYVWNVKCDLWAWPTIWQYPLTDVTYTQAFKHLPRDQKLSFAYLWWNPNTPCRHSRMLLASTSRKPAFTLSRLVLSTQTADDPFISQLQPQLIKWVMRRKVLIYEIHICWKYDIDWNFWSENPEMIAVEYSEIGIGQCAGSQIRISISVTFLPISVLV